MTAAYDLHPGYPDNRGATPEPLRAVQAFVNTLDRENGIEGLAEPEALRRLLADFELADAHVSADELARAVELRDALRGVFLERAGVARLGPIAAARLAAAMDAARPGLAAEDGTLRMRPRAGGVDGALGELLMRVHDASLDGSLRRLKACRRDPCHWLFWDCSPPATGVWCSMSICGNRTKVQRFRAGATA
jgi:predicted RNA-binding Zn ribbon-like protein